MIVIDRLRGDPLNTPNSTVLVSCVKSRHTMTGQAKGLVELSEVGYWSLRYSRLAHGASCGSLGVLMCDTEQKSISTVGSGWFEDAFGLGKWTRSLVGTNSTRYAT